jgi:EAL domain-containing protein (putative c-di-GMP-specific phosphodiesterase class I)
MFFNEIDIRHGFEADEFLPFFQPLVELRTGQIAGFEVLARWQHGKLGSIAPDNFIPVVEKCGLINQLTRKILEKAFAAAPLLPDSLTLAVNFSPMQLLDFRVPGIVEDTARTAGFSLRRLTVEITESALLDDLPRVKSVVREFKEMHCRLSLDDFGTGYSSLNHLQALPFDKLKIDRQFVAAMTQNRESGRIVAAMVGMGQSLGLTTVAEGVENEEQARMLIWHGCDMAQGWLYGRPVPAAEIQRMVSAAPRTLAALPLETSETDFTLGLDKLPAQRLARLQAIYDGVPAGLCFLDSSLRYASLNLQLAQINGLPIAAHMGKTVAEILPAVYPRIEPLLRRALQGETVTGIEVRMSGDTAATGQNEAGRLLLYAIHPARDPGGRVAGISCVVMDVTGQDAMAKDLLDKSKRPAKKP